MKALFAILVVLAHVPAFAGTFYKCIDPDVRYITMIVDFENGDIGMVQRGTIISSEGMKKIEPKFTYIGESLSLGRKATTESGEVQVRKLEDGSHVSAYYQGALTFGDRWDFECVELND